MFRYLSIFVLIAAVFYFTPDHAVERRAPIVKMCVESTPVKSQCASGNALVFYNGPSAHTTDLLNTLTKLKINGTFIIETDSFTDWTVVNQIINYGHSYFLLT
eukprot:NODE_26_length_35450_cov_0.398320.p31 type:complete len:103 gc:universal NODE_26_length_35450_cov_0.398320:27063-26755(-)